MTNILSTLILVIIGFLSHKSPEVDNLAALPSADRPVETRVYDEIAASAGAVAMPSHDVFSLAFKGYEALKEKNSLGRNILTVADFSAASTEKRLWVFDMDQKKILFNELVAHGKNSGDNMASRFSNTPHSNMSSIGFYITGDTYTGKHGLSLFLDGQDKEFNSKARERAIVMHGADYVSNDFIKAHGRLGRSFGCPALSMESYKKVIETISSGSCLFIYYPDQTYLQRSTVLN